MFRVGDLLNEIRQKVCVEYHMQVNLLCPTGIYICDGSDDEAQELTDKLVDRGMLVKLDKLDNCYLCRTDPAEQDVHCNSGSLPGCAARCRWMQRNPRTMDESWRSGRAAEKQAAGQYEGYTIGIAYFANIYVAIKLECTP